MEEFYLIDLGNGFYAVQFANTDDRIKVMTGMENHGSLFDGSKVETRPPMQ